MPACQSSSSLQLKHVRVLVVVPTSRALSGAEQGRFESLQKLYIFIAIFTLEPRTNIWPDRSSPPAVAGLVSPGGGDQAQWYHPVSLSSEQCRVRFSGFFQAWRRFPERFRSNLKLLVSTNWLRPTNRTRRGFHHELERHTGVRPASVAWKAA